jgi:CBS domain containing-hemolysin-like protein
MSIVLAVVFLLGNAVFVAAQFSLITSRVDQVRPLAEQGRTGARAALGQLQSLSRMLAGSQLGIAVCSLGLGAVAEPAFAHGLEHVFGATALPSAAQHTIAFIIALAFVSFCHMVIGEMVPKNLALAGPVRAALLLAPPMAAWVWLTRPILVVTESAANGVLRLLRVEPKSELGGAYTSTELADLFTESAADGLLDPGEQRRLHRALRLERATARDLCVPLDQLITITERTTAHEVEELVARTGLSRFPVRRGDELLAYVHVRDVLGLADAQAHAPLPTTLRRPLVTVRAEDPIDAVFVQVQRADSYVGRVVAGSRTIGAVSMADLLGPLVAPDPTPSV